MLVDEYEALAPVAPAAAAPAAAPAPAAPVAPAAAPAAAAPVAAAAGEQITAPMPGTVLKVNTSQGAAVKKGDVLLVLEAMKMENEIQAPRDGVVAQVAVSKGSEAKPRFKSLPHYSLPLCPGADDLTLYPSVSSSVNWER